MIAPGGTQRVEWRDDGIYLTGWAEVVFDGRWVPRSVAMQTFHEAVGAVETFSPAEEQFNRRRRTAGLFLAPAIFLVLLFAPFELPMPAHRMAAIMGLVVTLWITEALPLA